MTAYYVCSGAAGTGSGLSWVNACTSIPALMTAITSLIGGDVIYVHNTHSYNAGAAITWTLPESGAGIVKVLCVDGGDAAFTSAGASMGTTVGSLTTGAIEGTNGNFTFTINTASNIDAMLYVQGMKVQAGQAGQSQASADFQLQGNVGKIKFVECSIELLSNASGSTINLSTTAASPLEFENCTVKFGATGQSILIGSGPSSFRNCKIDSGGSSPTTLFTTSASSRNHTVECTGCDWSLATNCVSAALACSGRFTASNCAIGTPTTGTYSGYANITYEFMACDPVDGTNGANILSYYYEDVAGTVQDNQTVYKSTGGAQGEQDDGTDTSYSLQMDPSTKCSPYVPLYTPWIYVLVGTTGDKTVTMITANTESSALTTSEIWMEVQYMGEPGLTGTQRVANAPHAIIEVDDNCNLQASSLSRDVTAAGSARTDDGVDDWAGITSEKEHTLTASINCAEVGYIRCRVGLGKDTTNAVYVDPKITVA